MSNPFFLLLALAAASLAHAAPVIDFSEDNSAIFRASMGDQEEARVLRQAYPHYVKEFDQCPKGTLEAKTEVIISGVLYVRGNFTARDSNDMLVTFESVRCNEGHAGYHPNILLVQDGRLVRKSTKFAATRFERVLDVDGDGIPEVITSSSYSNQGYTITTATTLSFRGGIIRDLPFVQGGVHFDECGLAEGEMNEYDAVFFRDSKNPQRTVQQNFVKPCGAGKEKYKLYSKGPLDKAP